MENRLSGTAQPGKRTRDISQVKSFGDNRFKFFETETDFTQLTNISKNQDITE